MSKKAFSSNGLLDTNYIALVSAIPALAQIGETPVAGANDPALPYLFPGGAVRDGRFSLVLNGTEEDVLADKALIDAAVALTVIDFTLDFQDTAGNSLYTVAASSAPSVATEGALDPGTVTVPADLDFHLVAVTVTNTLVLTTLSLAWEPAES